LAFAATTYRRPVAEFTQAEIDWALTFCGPASSTPTAATLARSSFENIYFSTCYETANAGLTGTKTGIVKL
jgi:hypothetical protein